MPAPCAGCRSLPPAGRNSRSSGLSFHRRFCHLLLEDVTAATNNTSVPEELGSSRRVVMGDLLGARGHLLPDDKKWMAILIIGVAFAITILAWIALKIRSLFLEDEGSTGGVGDFLGHLRDSQSEGDLTPEEFRSIQRRLVEQQLGSGDSSRLTRQTPAKIAGPPPPTPPVPYHDDADDHSP